MIGFGCLFAWLLYPFGVRIPTVEQGERLLRDALTLFMPDADLVADAIDETRTTPP